MDILITDLDNTLIYSYKHDIGKEKRAVELYQGREISFMTEKTYQLLKKVRERMLVIPVTTRTVEQYERIHFGVGPFPYALACNGGVLLVNGAQDAQWRKESLRRVEESHGELELAMRLLAGDARRTFELRLIERLFVFTKCKEPEMVVRDLRERLNVNLADVFHNGEKIYVLPKKLTKGDAVRRLLGRIKAERIFAAGDSEFDISMLKEAERRFVPHGFYERHQISLEVEEAGKGELLSEAMLRACCVQT